MSREPQAIAEVRQNARMLLRDARLLFVARRWGTSIALSILACEEAAKFLMFNYMLGTGLQNSTKVKWHAPKQEEFSRYLRSCLKVRALDEYFLEKGETDQRQRLISGLKFLDRLCALNGSGEAPNDPELSIVCHEIEKRIRYDQAYKVAEEATTGKLDGIKQRGLYVDVREGAILSPQDFCESDARIYLRAADIVVEAIAPEKMFGNGPVPLTHVQTTLQFALDDRE